VDILTLASGSSGNCYRVKSGDAPLLLECGIAFKEIRKGVGFSVSEIAGCLITHSHNDHSRACADMMKAGVNCYMSQATADEIGASGHRVRIIRPMEQLEIGCWTVLPFDAVHDAECLGFLLACGDEKLLYLTDTAYCRYRFKGLTHIMLEANYASDIIRDNVINGEIPIEHHRRVVRNHMSLERAKELLRANDLSKVREIWLIHLSDDNSDAERFVREVQAVTGKPVYVAGNG